MFIIILLIVSFIVIKNSSIYKYIVNFDYKVIEFFGNINDKRLTTSMSFITNFGDWYIPILIIVCIFLIIKNKWYFYTLSSSYLLSGIVVFITKILVARPRPLEALIKIPSSYSFPSGHTLTSLIFYMTLFYLMTEKSNKLIRITFGLLFCFLIVVVAFSRVCLGVHFFSDVVGGFILGIPCLLCCINIIEKNFKEKL
ncbi:MAG: phosphatase PAP2 family protein [Mollicutes bacterium]|nr:phosphatase PAP2 family protein [Mollicutes bacterium]